MGLVQDHELKHNLLSKYRVKFAGASDNTEFPQLEDDACGLDAAGTPKRYATSR